MSTHPRRRAVHRLLALSALAILAVAGCGGDEEAASSDPAAPRSTPATTTEAEPTTTTAPAPHEGDIDVVAAEFRFDDLPAVIAAGPHTLRFENQGTETHELFLFRNPDGVPLEELAELGPAGAVEAVDLVSLVVAEPGGSADPVEVELTPGTYEVACFIPTPTDDRAHFEHGMHATFTVE